MSVTLTVASPPREGEPVGTRDEEDSPIHLTDIVECERREELTQFFFFF